MGILADLHFYCNGRGCRVDTLAGFFHWPQPEEVARKLAERQWTYDAETNTALCPKHGGKKSGSSRCKSAPKECQSASISPAGAEGDR